MQPTGSSSSRQQSTQPAAGHLASTPGLNASGKLSPPPSSDLGPASSSSGKWKTSAGSSPAVFSVITRGSRQPAKQPMPPSKPHPTASRISRLPSASSDTPHNTRSNSSSSTCSSSSLSLRSSSRSGSSSSKSSISRVSSVLGSSGSGASNAVLGRRAPGACHDGQDSTGSSCTTGSSSDSVSTSDCKSLVRVLTFDVADVAEVPDQHSRSSQHNSSTATRKQGVHAGSTHTSSSAHPPSSSCVMSARSLPKSRIPAAPGTTAKEARPPATNVHAAASRIPQAAPAAVAATGAADRLSGAAAAAHGDAGLELLTQQAAIEDSSSTTWLSDGSSSEEELQQLAGDACMVSGVPAADSIGDAQDADSHTRSAADEGSLSSERAPDDESERGLCAGGVTAVAGVAEPACAVVEEKMHSRSARGVGWTVLVLWSVVLLACGFIAAALVMGDEPTQGQPMAADAGAWAEFLEEEDITCMGMMSRRYSV